MSNIGRPAPYMVALSGWPEPVYIAGQSIGSSRSSTPGPSTGEYREGISSSVINSHAHPYAHARANARHPHPYAMWPTPSDQLGQSQEDPSGRTNDRNGNVAPAATPQPPPTESILSRVCMYQSDPNQECPIPDHPNHIAKYGHPHSIYKSDLTTSSRPDSPSAFPTSSTRGTPHPSPPHSRGSSPRPRSTHSQSDSMVVDEAEPPQPQPQSQPQTQAQAQHTDHARIRGRGFRDPRLAPHVAVLSNRPALPLAPSWGSSSVANHPLPHSQSRSRTPGDVTPPSYMGFHPQSTGVGVKVPAGQRGTGILVMRAVPDVYPPPASVPGIAGMATEMSRTASHGSAQGGRRRSRVGLNGNVSGAGGVGGGAPGLEVATEVYPRDPDSAILWGTGVPSRKPSTSSMSRYTPTPSHLNEAWQDDDVAGPYGS